MLYMLIYWRVYYDIFPEPLVQGRLPRHAPLGADRARRAERADAAEGGGAPTSTWRLSMASRWLGKP